MPAKSDAEMVALSDLKAKLKRACLRNVREHDSEIQEIQSDIHSLEQQLADAKANLETVKLKRYCASYLAEQIDVLSYR